MPEPEAQVKTAISLGLSAEGRFYYSALRAIPPGMPIWRRLPL
jgi:hypothetical protein